MDRSWLINGGIGAAAFAGVLVLLIPSTETKASWSSIHHQVTAHMPAPTVGSIAPDHAYPATYAPPEPQQPWRDTATDDEATAHEIAVAEEDRAYGDGYAWASEQEVQSERECRRLAEAGAEGCRDYVASLAPAAPESEPATGTL